MHKNFVDVLGFDVSKDVKLLADPKVGRNGAFSNAELWRAASPYVV